MDDSDPITIDLLMNAGFIESAVAQGTYLFIDYGRILFKVVEINSSFFYFDKNSSQLNKLENVSNLEIIFLDETGKPLDL